MPTRIAMPVRLLMAFMLGLTFLKPSRSLAIAPEPFLVADINPLANSFPEYLTAVDDSLYFIADDGQVGEELWKSGPTGTSLVKDIAPGPDPMIPHNLKAFNGLLYFTANDNSGSGEELWTSNGTLTGTLMLKDINPSGNSNPTRYTAVNGLLFFQATDGVNGYELWKTDGTQEGTVMVKDINPNAASSSPTSLTGVNETLFFVAIDDVHGEELWKSDGTEAGTVLVKDIYPGMADANVRQLSALGELLFFRANDGVHGDELWKSNGSEAGTILVKDIFPGENGSTLSDITMLNGMIFFQANDGSNGAELWASDGTESGTQIFKDIASGPSSSNPAGITDIGGLIYFSAFDLLTGREVWTSDGTQEGTRMVKDINSTGSSTPIWFISVNDIAIFQATDNSGAELWKSAGDEETTILVKDIKPGSGNSAPDRFVIAQDMLFFVADDGEHGRELWALDLQNQPPTALPGGPYAGVEGSPVPLIGSFTDDSDSVSSEWISSDPGCIFSDPNSLETSITCFDNGEITVTLQIRDWWNAMATDQAPLTISNVAPQIVSFSAQPRWVGEPVEATVLFSDAGQADTHTATISWAGGPAEDMLVDQELDSAIASHIFDSEGTFNLQVILRDDDGASAETSLEVHIRESYLHLLPLIER